MDQDSVSRTRTGGEALDLVVERLVRTRFGPVSLGQLPSGASRPLNGRERDIILAITQ